jgi:hypothetical protein
MVYYWARIMYTRISTLIISIILMVVTAEAQRPPPYRTDAEGNRICCGVNLGPPSYIQLFAWIEGASCPSITYEEQQLATEEGYPAFTCEIALEEVCCFLERGDPEFQWVSETRQECLYESFGVIAFEGTAYPCSAKGYSAMKDSTV